MIEPTKIIEFKSRITLLITTRLSRKFWIKRRRFCSFVCRSSSTSHSLNSLIESFERAKPSTSRLSRSRISFYGVSTKRPLTTTPVSSLYILSLLRIFSRSSKDKVFVEWRFWWLWWSEFPSSPSLKLIDRWNTDPGAILTEGICSSGILESDWKLGLLISSTLLIDTELSASWAEICIWICEPLLFPISSSWLLVSSRLSISRRKLLAY